MCFDLTDCDWADVKSLLVWVQEQILVTSSQQKPASILIDADSLVLKARQADT